jgi:hypothetical protein
MNNEEIRMKKLPAGISTFSKMIENDYIYVDKTQYIHEMVSTGEIYFLSRPRRFGKSLLVSTLEELFKGNKKLFKDLYIYDKWDWNEKHSVIHLDLGNIDYENPEMLKLSLEDFIMEIADEYAITLKKRFLNSKFKELIQKICEKTGKKLVVLIDEYDKPIIDKISNIQVANDNREILSNFYQILKGTDKYLRFIFLTGVSKFSKTTIFSKLNNLTDITLNPKYSMICGYTKEELKEHFSEYIADFSKKNNIDTKSTFEIIKKWYNGYSWDGENLLYNPFSIISFLNSGEFNNYWFDTGTPRFLINIIKERDDNSDMGIFLNPVTTFAGSFPEFDIEQLDLTTTLLQTGYLTIKDKEIELGELPLYTIGIPNKEVDESFYAYLLGVYTNKTVGTVQPLAKKMLDYILKADEINLTKSLEVLLSNIPYILHQKIGDKNEAYYHILFLSWMKLMGFDIQGEIQTFKGRIDAVLKQKDEVVVIEIKYSENKSIDKLLNMAMNQIEEIEYYKPYQDKNITLLAIAFKEKEVGCKIKQM